MLRSRVLTAAIGLPAIGLAIGLGPGPFGIFLIVVSSGCVIELARLLSGSSRRLLAGVTVIWAALLATRYLIPFGDMFGLLITVPLVVALLLLLPVGRDRMPFVVWGWSLLGALYVGWMIGHWGGVYILESGPSLVALGLVTTFGYDTSAYFAGRLFGSHKLAPSVSEGKTIEGMAGGMIGAALIAAVTHALLSRLVWPLPFGLPITLLVALVLSVSAQFGDLVESALKRSAHAKDAGTILRGHGGMLDRFDSVLFTGTVLYYVSLWLTA